MFLSGSFLSAFPPKNFPEFQSNIDRLLGNRQYTFLADYFKAYGPLFKGEPKVAELSLELGLRLPRLESRQQVFKTSLDLGATGSIQSRLAMEYGLTLLLQGRWEEAVRSFKMSRLPEAGFYLAEAQFQKKDFAASEKSFEVFLDRSARLAASESKEEWVGRSRLRLAEIAFEAGEYQKCLGRISRAMGSSADLLILKYRVHEKTRSESAKKQVLAELKVLAKDSVKVQTFLADLK